jgi:hypothetical protein
MFYGLSARTAAISAPYAARAIFLAKCAKIGAGFTLQYRSAAPFAVSPRPPCPRNNMVCITARQRYEFPVLRQCHPNAARITITRERLLLPCFGKDDRLSRKKAARISCAERFWSMVASG